MGNGMLKRGVKSPGIGPAATDNYVDPNVSRKLPTPEELTDKDKHIAMLQADLTRAEKYSAQLRMTIGALRQANEKLREANHTLRMKMRKPRGCRLTNDSGLPAVKDVRQDKGISTRQISEMLGCSRSAYNQRELGTRMWPRKVANQVCEILGIKESDVWWSGGIRE